MERVRITSHLARLVHTVLTAIVLVTVAACGSTGNSPNSAQVSVISPLPQSQVTTNVSITIQAHVTGNNIARVNVYIDGQPYAVLTTDDKTKGMPSFPVNLPWVPSSVGLHVVQFDVYAPDGSLIVKSDPVMYTAVSGAVAAVTASAAAQATARIQAPATATPAAPAVVVATATPVIDQAAATGTAAAATGGEPRLTITGTIVNVRSGPGITYDILGQLHNGITASVKGKNADGTWWQISYPSAPGGAGWVIGSLVQTNVAAAGAPVVAAPPTPTPAPSTPAPVGGAQTSTPVPAQVSRPCDASSPDWVGKDPRYPFCVGKVLTWYDNQDGAHRYENGHDESVSLSWDIWGVQGIWIVFEQDNSGYCGYTKQAVKTINDQVPLTGTYSFNVKDFPGGATMRIYLNIKRNDGQVVQYGDKRLCIY